MNLTLPLNPPIELQGIHFLESDSKEAMEQVYHLILKEYDTTLYHIHYVSTDFLEIEGTLKENIMMKEESDIYLHQILCDLNIVTFFPRWKLEGAMPFPLSKEEKQIINLVRAMMSQPDVLLIEDAMDAIRPTLQRVLLLAFIEQFSAKTLLLSGESVRNLVKNMEIDTIFLNQLAKSV